MKTLEGTHDLKRDPDLGIMVGQIVAVMMQTWDVPHTWHLIGPLGLRYTKLRITIARVARRAKE